MSEFQEVTDTIDVPKNTGVDGLLHLLRLILKRPRVQKITIDTRGKVTYLHYVREGDDKLLSVDFEFLQPYAIIRNQEVKEIVPPPGNNAPSVVAYLFDIAARAHYYPVAFVSGAGSHFWRWHEQTCGLKFESRDSAYGIPFMTDREFEDSDLLLCTAFGRGSSFAETQRTYRIVMNISETYYPKTTVDI